MATPASESSQKLHELIVDGTYQDLTNRFTREGKGRRPDAAAPPLTNRVLVQLWDIMLCNGHEHKKVVDWFGYLYKDNPAFRIASPDRLRSIISSAYAKALHLVEHGCRDIRASFLDVVFDFGFVSDVLSSVNLNRETLLDDYCKYQKPQNFKLSNGIVFDLDKFQKSEKLCSNFTAKWLFFLLKEVEPKEEDKKTILYLNNKIVKIKNQKKKIRSNKRLDPDILKTFFNEEFSFKIDLQENPEATLLKVTDKEVISDTKTSRISYMKQEKSQLSTSELLKKISLLEKQLDDYEKMKAENVTLKREIKNLKYRIWRSETKVANTKYYLQNSERKRKLDGDEKDKVINQLETNLEIKKRKVKQLKKEKRSISRLKQKNFSTGSNSLNEVQIKSNENNAYSNNVRQAAILLQSEAGVSSHNVSKVIRIIGKHIFDYEFNENLPSFQTCLNMNVEGLVISNMQVAEKMLDSKNVTLHLDGTSRDHQKVVNHQVTLDDGSSLYLGFTLVATEDSNTILDITLSLLKKISECHGEISKEQAQEIFLNLLRKIKNTMTDRAATMKLFDKKLEEFLKSEIGEDFELNFLHCNAHFLLGMSDVTDKAFKKIEDEIKQMTEEAIGRDKDVQFSRFSGDNETCTNRLIRTLCDVLGPRGDQKNGCRIEWKEFCPDSQIPSFKSNRFNCYFEAAAAIIYHYDKINSFFTSGILSEKPNQKIQSVSQDIRDLNLMSCICALALFYLKVSGPYWKLVNSSTPYSQFCQHVRTMQSKFLEWASSEVSCQSGLLNSDSCDLFGSNFSLSNSKFSASVLNFLGSCKCNISIVKQSLQAISEACGVVASRQLANFLDGSFNPNDEALAEVLKNCPLTNLIGESSFGDLDYDIRKRANCSNLQRSAAHCVKRNKTCSDFLNTKSKSEKSLMFSAARKQRKYLVEDARSQKAEMSIKIREKMIENQQKKIDKETASIEKHGELLSRLDENGGICRDEEEVEKLIENLSSKKSKKQIVEVIKDQIRYHKLVRNIKDKDLNMTGTFEDIVFRLKNFLNK